MQQVVQVYRNIHRSRRAGQPVYSIRDKRTRRVIDHATDILLADARFHVNENGRQRVLQEKRKNVHAYIEGTLIDSATPSPEGGRPVSYNPYRGPSFVQTDDGTEIHQASKVFLGTTVTAFV